MKTDYPLSAAFKIAAIPLAAALALSCGSAGASERLAATITHAYPVVNAQRVGSEPGATPLHVSISLKLQNRADLDEFLKRITTFGEREFGTSIGREDFTERYAPSAQRAQAVADFLSRSGFNNVEIAPNRLLVSADGTIGRARSAFHTDFDRYRHADGSSGFVNTRQAFVPAELSDVVLSVMGLQTIESFHPLLRLASPPRADHRQSPDSAVEVGHNPTEFATIYNAAGTPVGTGFPVGTIAAGDMTQTLKDLASFEQQTGINTPSSVIYVGTQGAETAIAEWNLDSQNILGMSGGVQKLYFYVANNVNSIAVFADTFNRAVTDNIVKAINVSLGTCEDGEYSSGDMAAIDQTFAEAVAQGQTFFVSSGDSGSAQCGRPRQAPPGVSYPASSPYVVSVGGTTLFTDSASSTTYVSESTWSSGGGGYSKYESAPTWQPASLTGSSSRGVPDIASDADPNSGSKIIINGAVSQYGGTSLAAPLSVGSWARVWTYFGSPIYFMGPLIYSFVPGYQAGAHDVVTGSNGAYSAGLGWDPTTGFGTWNVHADIYGY